MTMNMLHDTKGNMIEINENIGDPSKERENIFF